MTTKAKKLTPLIMTAITFFTASYIAFGTLSISAHTNVFPHKWDSNPTVYRGYLAGSLDTEEARKAMYRGDDAWEEVDGSEFEFIDSTYQNTKVLYLNNSCLVPWNNSIWFLDGDLPSNVIARNNRCIPDDDIVKSTVTFDSADRDWYAGTGTPPSGHYDIWGVATHELGHAAGWSGNLSGPTYCPATSSKHTMCSPWSASQLPWARDLEEHDEHSIKDAY